MVIMSQVLGNPVKISKTNLCTRYLHEGGRYHEKNNPFSQTGISTIYISVFCFGKVVQRAQMMCGDMNRSRKLVSTLSHSEFSHSADAAYNCYY